MKIDQKYITDELTYIKNQIILWQSVLEEKDSDKILAVLNIRNLIKRKCELEKNITGE